MSRVTPRFLASLTVGGGVPFTEMENVRRGADWGPLTLPAFTVMLMSVSPSPPPQLILPEASWVGTCPSSLSLLLTQHRVGLKEALEHVCGVDE